MTSPRQHCLSIEHQLSYCLRDHKMIRIALGKLLPAVLALALGACKTSPPAPPVPEPTEKPQIKVSAGPIQLPSGASYRMAQLAERGEKPKVYAQVRGMGDPSNEKLLLRADVAAAMNVTAVQIQRRFNDTIGKTRRYEVYDLVASPTAEASDYVVDAQFVSSNQELRPLEGGVRVAVTRVQINAKLVHRYSGEPVWDAPVEALGVTGLSSSDRITVMPGERLTDPDVQRRLGIDYELAMQRAFDRLATRIDSDLRPMGRVAGTGGDGVSIIGGTRNGLQRGDDVVVFRAGLAKVGNTQDFIDTQAVATLRCQGVGGSTSQCDVIRLHPGRSIQVGDYVVLTDHSSAGSRSTR